MAAAALPKLISVDEYLRSAFEPDMDFVDGTLEKRNMGELDHADLQSQILFLLRSHAEEWRIRAVVEARVQVSPTRFRVPDVCLLPLDRPRTQIVHDPPTLCIEVLSPEDRLSRTLSRCEDYLAMGVPEVWVFHPAERLVLVVRPGAVIETLHGGVLTLAGTAIQLSVDHVFGTLDI